MRDYGVEVYYVHELLTETLASVDEATKRAYVGRIVNEYTVGWGMVDELRAYIYDLPPAEPAEQAPADDPPPAPQQDPGE